MKYRQILVIVFLISQTISSFAQSAGEWSTSGFSAYLDEDYKEAIQCYNEAIVLDSTDVDDYLRRGNSYYELGRYGEAIQDYNKVLEMGTIKWAYNGRGLAYYHLGKYKEALKDFSQAIVLDNKYDNAYSNRAKCYYHLGKYAEVIKDCEQLIALELSHYDEAYAHQYRAKAYQKLRQHDKAVKAYEKALKLHPYSREIKADFASLFIEDGEGGFTFVQKYVEEKINEWQKKGEFEPTADYQKRISEGARNQKIQDYTHKAMNVYGERFLKLSEKILEKYDADNQTFKVVFSGNQAIYLVVPLNVAANFKEDFSEVKFKNMRYGSNGGQLLITYMEAAYQDNTYIYDASKQVNYSNKEIKLDFDPIEINILASTAVAKTNDKILDKADIAENIPQTQMQNPDAIAVIIGNTNYEKTKNVDFAMNDASLIKQYLMQTLGYKEGNIFHLGDIHKSEFEMLFGSKDNHKGKLFNTVKANKSDVFIYYSGHGVPSIQNKSAYFAPVECDPNYVELSGYSLDIFYNNLAKIPAKSMTIVLDACFSGVDIYENISPIVVKSKGIVGIKKGILLTSCQGNEVSSWYNEKGHSLFTYFFLKAIHNKNADADKNGKLTFQEIQNYISNKTEGVPYFARRLHGIEQNPTLQGEDLEKVLVNY